MFIFFKIRYQKIHLKDLCTNTKIDFVINSGKKIIKSSKDLDLNFWEDLKIEYTILNHECAI